MTPSSVQSLFFEISFSAHLKAFTPSSDEKPFNLEKKKTITKKSERIRYRRKNENKKFQCQVRTTDDFLFSTPSNIATEICVSGLRIIHLETKLKMRQCRDVTFRGD